MRTTLRATDGMRSSPTARGFCPNCGETVPRFSHQGDGRVADVYACPDCGRFSYTNDGPQLPHVVPKA